MRASNVILAFVWLWSLGTLPSIADQIPKIFDGKPKSIVVNGYSTSFRWPSILQRKLDRYFESKRIILVKSATKGGTPIAKWMDVETGKSSSPWQKILKPTLQKTEGPTIVLAQQSLQWAFGKRTDGIRGPDDRERIEKGANIIQKYAENLLEDGADEVFVAMHIYKHEMEPQIGYERLALAEMMKRNIPQVHAGPDVWEPMKKNYPKAFAGDLRHPNSIGAEIMAQKWFEILLKSDDLEVPSWSRKEMELAMKSEPKDRSKRTDSLRRQPSGRVFQKYDKER